MQQRVLLVKHLLPMIVSASLLTNAHCAGACAMALPAIVLSANQQMALTHEQAAIVWDPSTHTEHFIRRADFVGNANSLGFLVPTPEPPALKAADSSAFQDLSMVGEPKHFQKVLRGRFFTTFLNHWPQPNTASVTAIPSVEIVSTKNVGPYDATVLRANNAAALEQWLHKHGYAKRAALTQWLEPYVRRGWSITAFKISHPDHAKSLSLSSICMSFHTPRPFYPYREPTDTPTFSGNQSERNLSLYLLTNARMDGALETPDAPSPGKQKTPSTPWRGKTVFAKPLETAIASKIQQKLALSPDNTTHPLWITATIDTSQSRGNDGDLYFQPSPVQKSVEIPPILTVRDERVAIPVDLIALLAAGLIGFVWIRRSSAR